MGQRKKAHKFFRWMRQSDLPQPVDQPRTTNVSIPQTGPLQSSPPPTPPIPLPCLSIQANGCSPPKLIRPTNIALSAAAVPPCSKAPFITTERQPPETVILRVKELSAHQCFTQHTLRHIYVQPAAERRAIHSETHPTPATDEVRSAPPAVTPDATAVRALAVDRSSALAPSHRNAKPDYLTERKHAAKPALLSKQQSRLQTLDESPSHQPQPSIVNRSSKKSAVEKTVSCRLYECILPVTCTARTSLSEPPESRAPSELKLDLVAHQHGDGGGGGVGGSSSNSSCTNIISRSAQLSKKRFLLDAMDRSVDSIGSCSLDVDAESTDFSDTSGSLNLCTPSSGKDFTREFTSRIHERCQLGQIGQPAGPAQQRTTTILDPSSGKIRTILTASTVIGGDDDNNDDDYPTGHPAASTKKPSYLNLACCVNGYSNLTTYDSKLRQNINRSREVSPIRPIIHTLQYNRGETYLCVPVPMPIINDTVVVAAAAGKPRDVEIDVGRATKVLSSPDKRYFAPQQRTITATVSAVEMATHRTESNGTNGADVTDFKSSPGRRTAAAEQTESPKSFIQQRVERLYGPSALAAGFYSPKRSNGAATDGASILAERSLNSVVSNGSGGGGNSSSSSSMTTTTVHTKLFKTEYHHHSNGRAATENVVVSQQQSLPVLRHLRPEFRAQLPIVSPKRASAKFGGDSTAAAQSNVTVVATSKTSAAHHQNYSSSSSSTITTTTTSNKLTNGALHTSNNHHSNDHSVGGTNASSPTQQPADDDVVVAAAAAVAVVVVADDDDDIAGAMKHQRAAHDARRSTTATSPTNGSAATALLSSSSSHKTRHNHATNNSTESKVAASSDDDDEGDDVSVNTTVSVRNMKISDGSAAAAAIAPNTVVSSATSTANGSLRSHPMNGTNGDAGGAAVIVPVPAEAAVPGYTNGHHNGATTGDEAATMAGASSGARDGLYFLAVMNTERERLIALAVTAEQYMETLAADVDEEIVGNLRSAAGKARLLATQKIRQFEGLCHNNLNQVPGEKFPTTAGDLQGFWDMVMLQVDHVDVLFRDIELYRANNWQRLPAETANVPPTGSRLTKRPMGRGGVKPPASTTNGGEAAAAKKSAVALAAAQRREAQRKQLLELKRRAKKQQPAANDTPALTSWSNGGDSVVSGLTQSDGELLVNNSSS